MAVKFFDNATNVVNLYAIMEKWKGTPYFHMGDNSHGVDCTKLMGLMLVDLGILNNIGARSHYGKRWMYIAGQETVLDECEKHFDEFCVPDYYYKLYRYSHEDPEIVPEFGDIVGFRRPDSGATSHVGWYIDNKHFYHVSIKQSARVSNMNKFWWDNLTYIFRIFEV